MLKDSANRLAQVEHPYRSGPTGKNSHIYRLPIIR